MNDDSGTSKWTWGWDINASNPINPFTHPIERVGDIRDCATDFARDHLDDDDKASVYFRCAGKLICRVDVFAEIFKCSMCSPRCVDITWEATVIDLTMDTAEIGGFEAPGYSRLIDEFLAAQES